MIQEGDLILCTVKSLGKTSVFVNIDSLNAEGTIVTSEIAPGRIRNLRDYVVPGKKIVCKVLKIDEMANINLSLRRVSNKEKKEVMDIFEKERNAASIIKTILKERAGEVIEEVKKTSSLNDFVNSCRVNPQELEKYMPKEDADKLCKILQEKKDKLVEVKKEFKLSSKSPSGMKLIKESLAFCQGNCEISYLAAGRYLIKIKAKEYKEANAEISRSLDEIEKQAKQKKAEFEVLK